MEIEDRLICIRNAQAYLYRADLKLSINSDINITDLIDEVIMWCNEALKD